MAIVWNKYAWKIWENMRKICIYPWYSIAWVLLDLWIYHDLARFTMIYRWIGSRKASPLAAAIQGVACKACRTSASTSDIKQGSKIRLKHVETSFFLPHENGHNFFSTACIFMYIPFLDKTKLFRKLVFFTLSRRARLSKALSHICPCSGSAQSCDLKTARNPWWIQCHFYLPPVVA